MCTHEQQVLHAHAVQVYRKWFLLLWQESHTNVVPLHISLYKCSTSIVTYFSLMLSVLAITYKNANYLDLNHILIIAGVVFNEGQF